MAKINILTKEIYNRIAAGEVVDRPYSVVKELIENSIDAGATEIEIYIEKGGKQLIKVVDNGSGISADDLPAAFIAHATSKVSSIEDLDRILTLGFRGEALASIGAVSMAEIISITQGNSAYKIACNGGEISAVEPSALEKGTQITVRNLFFNTPVRAKFMKADKSEENDITTFVSRYILGNPTVSFRYYIDGKLTLLSNGGGLDEAVAQVYGAKVISQCFKIKAERNNVKIYGFIGNTNFFKPNKSYQTVFLNGRYIVNSTIATAISNAYASYAMKRQYPFYVLFVNVPVDYVDVNVHPNKADVRFIDYKYVFGNIYKMVSAILDGSAEAADFIVDTSRVPQMLSTMSNDESSVYAETNNGENESSVNNNEEQILKEVQTPIVLNIPDMPPPSLVEKQQQEMIRIHEEAEAELKALRDRRIQAAKNNEPYYDDRTPQEKRATMPLDTITAPQEPLVACSRIGDPFPRDKDGNKIYSWTKRPISAAKYMCCLFNTYLVYELGDDVFLIDKHAAHERVKFNEYMKELDKVGYGFIATQPLLYSYEFTVTPAEEEFLNENVRFLRRMGFLIEPCAYHMFRIAGIPASMVQIDAEEFIKDVLSEVGQYKELDIKDVLREKIAMKACKAAIKGGQYTSKLEIDKLFELLEGDMGLKCPHGRPICVKLTKKELEKKFKRIV